MSDRVLKRASMASRNTAEKGHGVTKYCRKRTWRHKIRTWRHYKLYMPGENTTLKEMECSNTKLFLEQEAKIRKEENRQEQQRIQSERQFQMQMFEMNADDDNV